MSEIVKWSEIKHRYKTALILGNGASIALHERFNYQSLFEEAVQDDSTLKKIKPIFEHLGTTDFEYVLRMLWHATWINEVLGIKEQLTRETYESLRTALIKTVKNIHPAHEGMSDQLCRIANFMKLFQFVVSLNYDLLVYWAMQLENRQQKNRFKDCFINCGFDSDWKKFLEPYSRTDGSTLVFYPHGNLALATDINGRETKLTASDFSSLLNTVTEKWESEEYAPLFVSEGTSAQKVLAINRSHYLKAVHGTVLPNLGSHITIFGWSMSDKDDHILEAICRGKVEAIAVSVMRSKSKLDDDERCREITSTVRKSANGRRIEVVFFEAESLECWQHDWGTSAPSGCAA
ncbi:MAG: DUF4917 family protein [Nitrospira sp.]|nr:DUF4917 family protein [Nitrospira sp.]